MDFFRQLFDEASSTYTYVLGDKTAGEAAIIDPVRDHLDTYVDLMRDEGLQLTFVLDTHVHADHVTASGLLRERLGAQTCLSEGAGVPCAGISLAHGEVIRVGRIEIEARKTPGHTSGCMTYVIHGEKMAFTGDALLIEGSGRTDFQQGDSRQLYASVKSHILALPSDTVLYPGHDYKGRTSTTVAHERAHNPRLGDDTSEDEFVEIMDNLNLAYPKQIDRALPLNLRCGISHAAPLEKSTQRSATGVLEVSTQWVLDNRHEVRLVDVREPDEFTGPLSHVKGSELVPMKDVAGAAVSWDKNSPIVIVCRSGGRSGQAAKVLEAAGFTQCVSMAGGMLAWNDGGLPVAPKSGATAASAAECG